MHLRSQQVFGRGRYSLDFERISKPLRSDIKDEDIRGCNFVPLNFEKEIQDMTLVEEPWRPRYLGSK